jgi:hypothetical protein
MALGLTQLLTEMSTSNHHASKGRRAHKADNFTAICEPMHYATSRQIAVSIPDVFNILFSIDLILSAALWPWGRLSL